MNDIVDDGKKDETAPGADELQAQSAASTSEEEGLPRKQSGGEQFPEVFWADAVSTTLYQTHPRVPQLKTEVQCQYKFENGRIYVRTLRYKMTTRNGNWYRANLDIALRFGDYVRHDSDDNLSQDNQWHDYGAHLESSLAAPDLDSYLVIRVNYDGTNNDVGPQEGWGVHIRPAQTPIIESPAPNAPVTMPFTVSGKNGLLNGKIMLTAEYTGNPLIGYPAVQSDGSWSASVTLPAGALSFYAEQIILNETSRRSNSVTIRLAPPPVSPSFTSPANGSVFKTGSTVLLKGRGTAGKTIDVMTPGGGILHGTTVVKDNGDWEVPFNSSNYPNGGIVKMQVGHRGVDDWSAERLFTLVARPTIALPASGAVTDPRGPISGGNAISGATVEVLKDLQHAFKIGQGIAGTDGQWRVTSFSQDMPPGAFSIVAQQRVSGVISDVSVARSFKVRPPALTSVSVTYPTITTAGFSGAGFTGSTVEITILKGPAGATVPAPVSVTAGSWSTSSQNWPVGDYDLKAVQKVSDNAGGWIPSQEYLFKATSILSPPTNVTYSVTNYTPTFTGNGIVGALIEVTDKADGSQLAPLATVVPQGWSTRGSQAWAPGSVRTVRVVQKIGAAVSAAVELTINIDHIPPPTNVRYTVDNYTPTFLGNGINGATIVLLDDGGNSSAAPDALVVSQQWSSRAPLPWGPTLGRNVNIRQGLNNEWSKEPVVLVVTIPLLAPVISAIEDDGLSPKISGTCWPGAVLSLKYSGDATEHKPSVVNGTWTFKRPAAFVPGVEYTVTVIQTFSGRDSPPVSQTFSVRPPTPLITEPSENADVGHDMIVRGEMGFSGATLQLYDAQFGRPLGAAKQLTAHDAWFIELKNLEFRKYQIDAMQSIAGRDSSHSEVRSFFVELLPPVIEVPAPDQALARTSVISGVAEPFGEVTVWREGQSAPLIENTPVSSTGGWRAEITLPVGAYTLRARQNFQAQVSKESPSRNYTVVPAAPFIESPGRGSHVGRSVVVSGFGYPGDTIAVTLTGSKNGMPGYGPVLADRSWSVTLEIDESSGAGHLLAVASRDGFTSGDSTAHPVMPGTYLPGIDEPAAGHWVDDPIEFAGRGRTGVGQVVSWYDPEQPLATGIAVTAQEWRGKSTQAIRNGGYWCRFQQTVVDGEDGSTLSDWVESARFEKFSSPPE